MLKENLVVFDIDGTVTDSVHIHQEAFIKSLLKLGVPRHQPEDQPQLNSFKHHTDSYIAKTIIETYTDLTFDQKLLQEFERELYGDIKKHVIVEIKGALKFIQYLQSKTNFGICFATGSLLQPAIHKLNAIGLQFEESLLVGANDLWERESIIQQAINQAKSYYDQNDFKTIISIGDGIWDLKAAQNLNLEFIGIGTQYKANFIQNDVRYLADDFSEFNKPDIKALLHD